MQLNINGQTHNIDVEPNMPLLWAIREVAGLTGTKYGCGACTVLPEWRTCTFLLHSSICGWCGQDYDHRIAFKR
jgi:aerobic-type carbon monoxide dehydrogenase small subunit (CoxS/CutS family)